MKYVKDFFFLSARIKVEWYPWKSNDTGITDLDACFSTSLYIKLLIAMNSPIKTSYRQMRVTIQRNTCPIPVSVISLNLYAVRIASLKSRGISWEVYTSLIVTPTTKIKTQKTINFMSTFPSHGPFACILSFPIS